MFFHVPVRIYKTVGVSVSVCQCDPLVDPEGGGRGTESTVLSLYIGTLRLAD